MQISKYSANGNDFAIFIGLASEDRRELAKKVCDRFNGIGADGLIVILPDEEYDFKWEFYNSDGSLASMCGNGSRAACMFAYENNLAGKKIKFLSKAGVISGKIYEYEDNIAYVEVGLTSPKELAQPFNENSYDWFFYDTGVPHLVSFVSDIEKIDFKEVEGLRHKYNANINFAQISEDKLFVRTFERGVEAETMACGTGMAACFYAGFKYKGLKNQVFVYPTSKERLEFRIDKDKIYFKGKVLHSFDAIFYG